MHVSEEYLKNRLKDNEAVEFVTKTLGKKAIELIRGRPVEVIRKQYIELWETNCYTHVVVLYGKAEIVDEEEDVCHDGPDVWRVMKEKIRIYPPAVIKRYKEPDRVYAGWTRIIILLPPKQ